MQNTDIEKLIRDIFVLGEFIKPEDFLLKQGTDNPLWYSLSVRDGHILLGRDGETLHAFTLLIKRILEKNFNEETAKSFTLDINDFHKKRIEQLKTTAHMLAERARFFKSAIDLDPMNPFDRRIVHEYLQNYTDLTTDSVGEGRNRHIVITYKPKEINEFGL